MFKSVSWTFWRCELKSATLTAPTVVVGWQLISSSHTTFMSTYALTISVRGGGEDAGKLRRSRGTYRLALSSWRSALS